VGWRLFAAASFKRRKEMPIRFNKFKGFTPKITITAEELEEMAAAGKDRIAIAQELGVHYSSLSRILSNKLSYMQAYERGRLRYAAATLTEKEAA